MKKSKIQFVHNKTRSIMFKSIYKKSEIYLNFVVKHLPSYYGSIFYNTSILFLNEITLFSTASLILCLNWQFLSFLPRSINLDRSIRIFRQMISNSKVKISNKKQVVESLRFKAKGIEVLTRINHMRAIVLCQCKFWYVRNFHKNFLV